MRRGRTSPSPPPVKPRKTHGRAAARSRANLHGIHDVGDLAGSVFSARSRVNVWLSVTAKPAASRDLRHIGGLEDGNRPFAPRPRRTDRRRSGRVFVFVTMSVAAIAAFAQLTHVCLACACASCISSSGRPVNPIRSYHQSTQFAQSALERNPARPGGSRPCCSPCYSPPSSGPSLPLLSRDAPVALITDCSNKWRLGKSQERLLKNARQRNRKRSRTGGKYRSTRACQPKKFKSGEAACKAAPDNARETDDPREKIQGGAP